MHFKNRCDEKKLNINNTCLQGALQILEVNLPGSIEKWKKNQKTKTLKTQNTEWPEMQYSSFSLSTCGM